MSGGHLHRAIFVKPHSPPTRIEYRPYCLPFLRPVLTAHGPWRERRGALVRVEDAAGRVCYTEAAPLPWTGATGGRGSRTFDLSKESLPPDRVQRLIGRQAPAPLPDAASREVAALLPAGRAAVDAMRDRRAAGFRTFKWKVGVASDPAEELDILDELCAELPTEAAAGARPARLRLDANGGWDQRTAERWLARCAELGSKIEFGTLCRARQQNRVYRTTRVGRAGRVGT